ncbi:MAG: monofunctional biosynthetic peptidoglycan transglycosylase [Deltaproteobacteria bacterium]|nr:monofunctional biosynthetic peptidoglycan transglycosylase [Deltaproteobacteria bacterium]
MKDLRALYPWSGRKRKKETLRPLTVLKRLVVIGLAATILPVIVLRWVPPPTTAFMLQKSVQARWNGLPDYKTRYRWTGWRHISPYAAQAVIAAEDQKFPVHWGFDPQSIAKAWEERQNGERIRGASTITQQTAKNLFLWPGKSFVRKGIEAYFTVLIESIWPKRRILEVYLNIVEFGPGVFGIAAASETFFKKTPDRLIRSQAALLAAALPNPRHLRVDRPSPYLRARAGWVMKQMHRLDPPAF